MASSVVGEIGSLLELSARIGSDPMLSQAATGNTSVKHDGVLWVKASGKWLAEADRSEILIPVDLEETRRRIAHGTDPAGQTALIGGQMLGTSIETAMHAVLPYTVILHVHSVNTIALAVRADGPAELARRLTGMPWAWVPYSLSGLPLARAVETAFRANPETRIFVLANHGLVVCGDSTQDAAGLLREYEQRVAGSVRGIREPDWSTLNRLSAGSGWAVPQSVALHAIGTDPELAKVVSGGILYPCQAIFLAEATQVLSAADAQLRLPEIRDSYVIIEGAGILVNERMNAVEAATLAALAEVLLRIPEGAEVRYLTVDQVTELLTADAYHYRRTVENNGPAKTFHAPSCVGTADATKTVLHS